LESHDASAASLAAPMPGARTASDLTQLILDRHLPDTLAYRVACGWGRKRKARAGDWPSWTPLPGSSACIA